MQLVDLKDENLCHMWKFTRNNFFFEIMSGWDPKIVKLFACLLAIVFLITSVCVCELGKKKVEFELWK